MDRQDLELSGEFSHGFAHANGLKISYAKSGNAAGPMMVLLHGFPQNWYCWRHQLRDLAGDYMVVAPDLRGYGRSDKPESVSDYRLAELVEDVVGLIHSFGRETAIVVGHDWGAVIAWELARKHPQIVEKLVCLQVPPTDIWISNISLRQLLASWYIFFFQLPGIPEYLISSFDFYLLRRSFRTSTVSKNVFTEADIERYVEPLRRPAGLRSAINYYRANFRKIFKPTVEGAGLERLPVLAPTL